MLLTKSSYPLLGHPRMWATQKCLPATLILLLPPTSNYYNISNTYLNRFIFCIHFILYLMSQYTEYEVNQALADISNGHSARDASTKWGVPRSTLQNRLKGIQPRDTAFADLQRLSVSQEAKLASWVQIQADLGLAPTHQQIREDWFKYLAIPAIMAIKPANRYNMDETGILKGKGSNGLVLGRAETKSVRKKQPGSRA
ncbi:transposase [Colletotrichum incanum]|uniref:Transposase n=1 Tax=Colletotrichum incanum TaxID=1573173 RepID=A0A161W6Y8_COLIC|nr:transposase [Colletotrichum incanum]